MKKIVFSCNREELVIRGHIFKPDGEGRKWPTIIISHAFGSCEGETMPYAEYLAEKGICCFTYNFCGGTLWPVPEGVEKSDGDFSQMTIESEMADLYAVLQYAKQKSYVDCSNITLAGCSQGGFVSARIAAKYPAEAGKLIMFYPALCIPKDSWSGQMLFFKFDPNNVPDFIETDAMPGLRLNGEYVRQSQNIDIYKELQSYSGQVTIMHGTQDEVVDYAFAQKLIEVRPETLLITMEGANHGFKEKDLELAKENAYKAITTSAVTGSSECFF